MKKTISREEAINLIKKNGGRVINKVFAIVGDTQSTYKVVRVDRKVVSRKASHLRDGSIAYETFTYNADIENPVLNGFLGGYAFSEVDGMEVKVFKKGKCVMCEFPDGTTGQILGCEFNGCEVCHINKKDAVDCDSWSNTTDWGRQEINRKGKQKMNNDKKNKKIIEFVQNNIINYMYFATSLFTIEELHEFMRLDEDCDISKYERWEITLGVKYDRPEFDKYINRISKMNTHIVGDGQWEGMCFRKRRGVLTMFKYALELTKSENYGKMIAIIDRGIVNDLYEKNKEQIAIDN